MTGNYVIHCARLMLCEDLLHPLKPKADVLAIAADGGIKPVAFIPVGDALGEVVFGVFTIKSLAVPGSHLKGDGPIVFFHHRYVVGDVLNQLDRQVFEDQRVTHHHAVATSLVVAFVIIPPPLFEGGFLVSILPGTDEPFKICFEVGAAQDGKE